MILRVRDDEGNVFDIPAIRGLSSYEIAVKHGFVGTEKEWLESIGVEKGDSAYQVAVEEGFEGDVTAWLESLIGPKGDTGDIPIITIGKVETLPSAQEAYVKIDENSVPEKPVLIFGIPKGADGTNGTNGTGLPSVTATDNGKFARVQDGKWKAVAISNAEEASF